MEQHYSLTLAWSDEDNGYIALCPEFPGVSAFGDTPQDAISEAGTALLATIETYKAEGWSLPEPRRIPKCSGRLLLRLPKSLHTRLAGEADNEGVSLNTHIIALLSATKT